MDIDYDEILNMWHDIAQKIVSWRVNEVVCV